MSNPNNVTNKNPISKEQLRNASLFGVFEAVVVDTRDNDREGRMMVELRMGKDSSQTIHRIPAVWTSPFAGSTDPSKLGTEIKNYTQTQKSYGMWMVPPDIGTRVLVTFADNSLSQCYVIGCLFPGPLTHMVPGMPAGKSYSDPSLQLPVAEKNKRDEKQTHNDAVRPLHVDLAEGIVKQGLANDPIRGTGTSGSRRESPSEVFGILTPGPKDPAGNGHRLGGHQFIMDDNLQSRLIRLRTAGGAQLLLDDTQGVVYVINKAGSAWVELDSLGAVNVYSDSNINFRAKGDFNIRADYNVNIEAGHDVNIKAAGDNVAGNYLGIGKIGPLGTGGNIRFEALADMTQRAAQNIKLSAAGGNLETSSAGATKMVAGQDLEGPSGFLVKTTGAMYLDAELPVFVTSKLGINAVSPAPVHVYGSLLNLNSAAGLPIGTAATSAVSASVLLMTQAPSLEGTKQKDSPEKPPEFDREAGTKGETAAKTAGKPTGKADKIQTIVSNMLTREPYKGHGSIDPLEASDQTPAPSQDILDALPAAAVDLSGKPVDVNSPEGFKAGTGYVDAATGSTISDFSGDIKAISGTASQAISQATGVGNEAFNAIGGQVDQLGAAVSQATQQLSASAQELLNGLPQFADINAAINEFKAAAEQKLLQITGLNGIIESIKAALPVISFPTISPKLAEIIGFAKQLTELEAQLKMFAIAATGMAADLLSSEIAGLKDTVTDAISSATGALDFQDKLKEAGISVIPDGPGTIFKDAKGNMLVDFSNGIGPTGATLGLVSDLNTSFENVKGSITAPLAGNQVAAISSFANSIGEENFLNSNVLRSLNNGDYADVPRQMQSWVLSADEPGGNQTVQKNLQDRRLFEASLWQTPDEVDISVAGDAKPGSKSFAELAEAIDLNREAYIAEKLSGGNG